MKRVFFSGFSTLGDRIKQLINWNFSEFNSIPFPDIEPHSFMYLSFASIWQTFIMTFAGTIIDIGTTIALPVAIFASKNIFHNKIINGILKTILAIFRTIPAFVFSLLFVGIFGPNMLTVTVAIIIFTFGMTAKMIYDRIEQIDMWPYEVLSATGDIIFGVIITEAVILGVVGAGNFGFVLSGYWTGSYYHEFGALLFGMIFTTVILELIINMLRNKIKNGLDPRFIYKFNKLIKRYQSTWYVINGRILDKNTVSMSFEELKALFKYTNVIIFRTIFKNWIKQCYKFKSKSRISWNETYANNYCHYFNLTTDNSIITMKEHNLQYVAVVKNLIESRKKYLKKSAKNKVLKIKTLKKDYKIAFKKLKKDYKLLKIKLNNEIMKIKKVNNTLNTNEQYNNKLRIDNLKKEYGYLLKKNKNDQKILKVDFNNDINIVKSLWKSVKLRHE